MYKGISVDMNARKYVSMFPLVHLERTTIRTSFGLSENKSLRQKSDKFEFSLSIMYSSKYSETI
jgi:hypothetical protein